MTITDFYGKKNRDKLPPHLMPREVAVQPLTRGELSPAAQDTLASISEALNELDRLRSELSRVTTDLEVERRNNDELKHLLDEERALKESYMRYAIEVKTHLQTIADQANKANSRAAAVAGKREEKISEVEDAIGEIVANEVRGAA